MELADLQDQEVGDGTTSVVIIAAELLRVRWLSCACGSRLCTITSLQRANELVRNKIHPTIIMSGYRMAMKEAIKYLKVCRADCQLLTGNAGSPAASYMQSLSFSLCHRQIC